ncbi:MAG: heavy metal translocating P-type ATPase [Alphaproteobacteria bacterium]|nr:heavy metal translocating P-type ATPase [Alphaproteobacteria bacterium]
MNEPLRATDYSRHVEETADGRCHLRLLIDGMHCAGCGFKIEKLLNGGGVIARVNVTEKRLSLSWDGGRSAGNDLVARAAALGFQFSPVEKQASKEVAHLRYLLRCIAVSGFAVGNLMVFSFALWFSGRESMGGTTRDLMHWYSALITLPTVIYAGGPFFKSAWRALRHRRTNMDVPIAVAVTLASAVSLHETIVSAEHVYFDSVAMLLFLLLIGRYLDARMRARARSAASDLLSLMQGTAHVMAPEELIRMPAADLKPGMILQVTKGERILADGTALTAASVDTSAITGETLPHYIAAGTAVAAGMVNLGTPLQVRVDKTQQASLIGDIVALMQKAEQGGAAYVRIADRIARWYTPVVHALALFTFLGWTLAGGMLWQNALLCAVTVLIITCPCALGLAVPVAQVMAGGRLFRRGMLLKSADALERLEKVDTVVFDKTGTLTTGQIVFENVDDIDAQTLRAAASLAATSRHPLAQALVSVVPAAPAAGTVEQDGQGVEQRFENGGWHRLGSAAFLGVPATAGDDKMELWFGTQDTVAQRLVFSDLPHPDAAAVIARLRKRYRVILLSGDRPQVTQAMAAQLGIDMWSGGIDPRRKYDRVDAEIAAGHHVLMVGDGLNDAAALSRASVSMSPSSALDIAQNAADIVYQRAGIASVEDALQTAVRTQRIVRQSFGMALCYNLIAVPLAIAGLVTPLVAAVSMSLSSLLVVGNALRLKEDK